MSAARMFSKTARPLPDRTPLIGVDAEFLRFLDLRHELATSPRTYFSGAGLFTLPASN